MLLSRYSIGIKNGPPIRAALHVLVMLSGSRKHRQRSARVRAASHCHRQNVDDGERERCHCVYPVGLFLNCAYYSRRVAYVKHESRLCYNVWQLSAECSGNGREREACLRTNKSRDQLSSLSPLGCSKRIAICMPAR